MNREDDHMNIVFVGHVDHGKSTIVGRLLADTNTLPKGKLEALKADCASQGKPFEYAFLIDALKDERKQNITIDTARIFFKSAKREYLILDAPGHIEFIKNMVTGASHAEAAVLVIDANEGIMENSRRHGVLLSMLGIRQLIVAINKMDLVGYDHAIYEKVTTEYAAFMSSIGLKPNYYIPISGFDGEGVASRSTMMPWYTGPSILEALDLLEKSQPLSNLPLRMPIQDVYKLGEDRDNRRIIAGTIRSGCLAEGDALVVYPSGKQTHLKELIVFNRSNIHFAGVGEAIGVTMQEQIYARRGEILCMVGEAAPKVSSRIKVSLFWIGREPLVKEKTYLLKLGTAKEKATVEQIHRVIDSNSYGEPKNSNQVGYHEVAEVELKLDHSIAFDTSELFHETSRFVLVDGFEIAGGGIVLDGLEDKGSGLRAGLYQREQKWIHGQLLAEDRAARFNQHPALLIITGKRETGRKRLANALQQSLWLKEKLVYYLGIGSVIYGVNADLKSKPEPGQWHEHLRRFGEVCHLLLDTGQILIITAVELTQEDVDTLRAMLPDQPLISVWVGEESTNLTPDMILDGDGQLEERVEQVERLLDDRFHTFTSESDLG